MGKGNVVAGPFGTTHKAVLKLANKTRKKIELK